VVVVDSAKSAMDSIKDRATDLVLTDVRMPKIDGLELLAKIRKHHPDIPVLLISGEPMSEDQLKISATADGFLAKPFTVDDLNDYIASGVDLRNAMKELTPHLKDAKKIRDAMIANSKDLEKLVKKGSAPASKEIQTKIKGLLNKAG
jgi:DNA-binding NtrC family response regulator